MENLWIVSLNNLRVLSNKSVFTTECFNAHALCYLHHLPYIIYLLMVIIPTRSIITSKWCRWSGLQLLSNFNQNL